MRPDWKVILLSYHCLKIGSHDIFDPTDSGKLEHFTQIERLSCLIELQSFKYNIHTDLVPELETIGQRLLRTVYPDGNSINPMLLNASVQTRFGEPMHGNGGIFKPRGFSSLFKSYRDGMWYLGRQFVVGQGRDEADNGIGNTYRQCDQIGSLL